MKKRTQRDYTFSFKLSVVSLVEKGEMSYKQAQDVYGIQGKSTVLTWLRKHGSQDWSSQTLSMKSNSKETPAQKIKRLEKELSNERIKTKVLNKMIDISDEQYGTSIRKKFLPKQSPTCNTKKD